MPATRLPVLFCLLVLPALLMAGCYKPTTESRIHDRHAQYRGLSGKSVGILIATSDYTNLHHPDAQQTMAREITRRIATNMPDVTVSNPDQITAWQQDNPYWTTRTPSMLIE